MRQQWFTHVRLLIAHPPRYSETSTAALTTPALDRRSLRWFGISACTATPEDLPPSLAQHGSCRRSSTSSSLPFRTHVGAGNCVVGGQAAFRYSLMSPPQRAVLTTWRCPSGWSGGSVATGGSWSSERWGRCVVVVDVVDDEPFELPLVPDDGAVEELASKGADPAFGERVRHGSAHRRLEDLHTFGSEDLVEGVDELASAVAHERAGVGELVPVTEQQVPRRLGGPDAGGVVRDPCEVHGPGRDVDEEQWVEPA